MMVIMLTKTGTDYDGDDDENYDKVFKRVYQLFYKFTLINLWRMEEV